MIWTFFIKSSYFLWQTFIKELESADLDNSQNLKDIHYYEAMI